MGARVGVAVAAAPVGLRVGLGAIAGLIELLSGLRFCAVVVDGEAGSRSLNVKGVWRL